MKPRTTFAHQLMRRILFSTTFFSVALFATAVCSSLITSASAQILTEPADTDGDGVPDSQEAHDLTDPSSPDSYIEHVDTTYCVDWNGYLNEDMQVMELRNAGCSNVTFQLALRDSTGAVLDTRTRSLAPTNQFDVVANLLTGFLPLTYGNLCATIQSGDPDTLDARMSTYTVTGGNSFRQAFSAPAAIARKGAQVLSYNNYFPTLNQVELSNHVEGWVQVSNDEPTVQTGDLVFYSQGGTEVKRAEVTVPAKGRYDSDSHTVGANAAGGIEWLPDDSTKRFRVVHNRYYFDRPSGGRRLGVVSLPARRPTGRTVAVPFQTNSRLTVLELTNALSTGVVVTLTVSDASGAPTPTQPSPVSILAKGTSHVILNQYLPSGTGMVQFRANQTRSVVSSLLEYGLNSFNRFSFANVSEPKAGFGITQRSSYNSYLGECRLRLANLTNAPRSTQVTVNRSNGTAVPFTSPVQVPANSVTELELCASDTANNYGGVILTPNTTETLVAEVIRENADSTVEFKTTATERSICSAALRLDIPYVNLTAAGGPQTTTITNTSTAVTALNLQATLPAGWNDVTVDVSNCASVNPGASCQVSFTPGLSDYAPASVSIVGSNTSEVLPIVTVATDPNATITVTGSPLVLTTNGPTGTLTINNTSLTTAATNVTSSLTGTALDGNVVETGNTCSSVAPQSSCTLTYTPGNTVVAQTNFIIQGTNTNAITAAIQIDAGVTLSNVAPNSGTASGGVGVTLTGVNLSGATGVTFGGVAATSVNVINSTTVTAVTPAHSVGVVDVSIDTPSGGATLTNGYTYLATAIGQSSAGGTIACLNGGLNNLIGAVADNSAGIGWGGSGTSTNAISTTDGAANTALIVNELTNNQSTPANSYAAGLCSLYEVDSQGNTPCQAGNTCYNDWFLPAGNNGTGSGQLNCLYTNRNAIGGFAATTYWSSTELSSVVAYLQNFGSGAELTAVKTFARRVRCVRAFNP